MCLSHNLPANLVPDTYQIITRAGEILLSSFGKISVAVSYKDNGSPVTEADKASEQYLKKELSRLVPHASFLGEETGLTAHEGDYCWVVDPLDGTANFIHGIPYFCISVALTHHGCPIFAMIYQPTTEDLFSAVRGGGAFFNGRQLQVTPVSEAVSPMLGMPYSRNREQEKFLEGVGKLGYSQRYFGCAALELGYLACGYIDGFVSFKLKWWDVAAGSLLVTEAGGVITDGEGKPLMEGFETVIAGTPQVHDQVYSIYCESNG
jgi:myo-inositol-1(or 4)-monophosphatase